MAQNHASTYLSLRDRLDNLRLGNGVPIYDYAYAQTLRVAHGPQIPPPVAGEEYLITQLAAWYFGYAERVRQTRTGELHLVMRHVGNDGRRQLPATLRRALNDSLIKVEVKWIACYLDGIHPPSATDAAGRPLECSHRCIDQDATGRLDLQYGEECIDSDCMWWESKSVNQSRGNSFCCRDCVHCGEPVCQCQIGSPSGPGNESQPQLP